MILAPQYLLDTDMCIYLLNGNERVKNRVAQVGLEQSQFLLLQSGNFTSGLTTQNGSKQTWDGSALSSLLRVRAFNRLTTPLPNPSESSKPPYVAVGSQ
jgi:hypothetical protein